METDSCLLARLNGDLVLDQLRDLKFILFFRLITFGEILKFITIYKTETSEESLKSLIMDSPGNYS